jgi:hypothetical protein
LYVAAVGSRLFTVGLAALAVVPGALALEREGDRVRLTPRGFSIETAAFVGVLPEFRRTGFDGDSGGWEGPICDHPTFPGPVALTWSVGFEDRSRSAEQAATAALTFTWTVVERSAISVRHVVGRRDVGAIRGALVVTDSGSPQGWHEAGLGFPLGRGVYAAAAAWSRGNTFACVVRSAQGPVPSSTWHRQKSRQAMEGIHLDGNLPPARVTARGSTSLVTGTVRDSFGHPVAGVVLKLERRAGGTWRRAASGFTSRRGSYAIRVRKPGRYRTIATLAGVSARSGVVQAGR